MRGFFDHAHCMWTFPGQGVNPSHSSDYAKSLPLGHQGTPALYVFNVCTGAWRPGLLCFQVLLGH